MEQRQKAIGVLDSGVGGLTLIKEFNTHLPGENIVYFGDTARMPYGPRSPEQVRGFALEIMDFLCYSQDIKLLIVACNTATAVGLYQYQQHFPVPVLGVLEPGVEAAVATTRNGKIGVIGTEGTIASKAYPEAIRELDENIKVFDKACPLFVLLVENRLVDTIEAKKIAASYLEPLAKEDIDTLILGCTHYPLLMDVIAGVMGSDVTLISSALHTTLAARETLEAMDIVNPASRGWQRYFVSGEAKSFNEIATTLLGYELRSYQVRLPALAYPDLQTQ